MQGSVSVRMDAPSEQVWELVADITNTGRFSPETIEAEWLDGASEPAVGVRFRGHVLRNGRPPAYWTVCRITECEPGRAFAFEVMGPGNRPLNTWAYAFEPDGDGTLVTESFRLTPTPSMRLYWTLLGWTRGKTNERGMRETLERIRAEVEGGSDGR